MNWFQRQSNALKVPDFVLHIGAGRGMELDVYRGFTSSRVILVEPQADLASDLAEACADSPNIRVVQAAIDEQSGENELHLINVGEYSSLFKPTGLLELFPGLAPVGMVPVHTLTLSALVSELSVAQSGDNWLVIDAPGGVEPVLVRSLGEQSNKGLFGRVFLRTGKVPLYQGGEPAEQLLDKLRSLGYEQSGIIDTADPDIPAYHMWLNDAAIEAKVRTEELEKSISDRECELAELRESSERRISELEQAVSEREVELAALRGSTAKLQSKVSTLGGQRESARSDLSIALRIQAMREADLKELQERYAAAIDMRDQQQQLLLALQKRLGEAADYLRRISAQPGEGADLALAGDIIRSLVGGGGQAIGNEYDETHNESR